ncbi:MAG: hypothetical protein JO057_04065 [Chloroflexi bacterium]|nr:hypothetical protein [Chloroflexota bacterium]
MADTQYARGMYHAHTPREKALLTTARPSTLRERFDEAPVVLSTVVRRLAS